MTASVTVLPPSSSDIVRVSAALSPRHRRARVGIVVVVDEDLAAAVTVDEHADVATLLGGELEFDADAGKLRFANRSHGFSLAADG